LLHRIKLFEGDTTPLGEVLEEITGRRRSSPDVLSSSPLKSSGTAAHKIGLLVLVGALLNSGGARAERGRDPLTLIENPEAHMHPMTLASLWSVIDRIATQKIVATHSDTLVANARLSSVRRLTRDGGYVSEWRVPDGALTADELRRYSYHLRSRRAGASFARCWLLVEGETEFWVMSELARICGYEFGSEGIACVEFAQCGLDALIKVARHFGIEWYLLVDGDPAGKLYAATARLCDGDRDVNDCITLLPNPDVEHCFWSHGYEEIFRAAAYPSLSPRDPFVLHRPPAKVIGRAIDRNSKPHMAALLLNAVLDRGPEGVPPTLRHVIDTCVRLARCGPKTRHGADHGPTDM
jgi:putative ATP-dependent endonuclease of OLD family